MEPARWPAHRQPIECSTKKMLLGSAAASQISPRKERSSPRIVRSPFVSACLVLRKDTCKTWQWFENVSSLLWAIQNPLKEMAIFHLMLSGSQWKIALKMLEPFGAEVSLADAFFPFFFCARWHKAVRCVWAQRIGAAKISSAFWLHVRMPSLSRFTCERIQWAIFEIIFSSSLKWLYENFEGCQLSSLWSSLT